MILTWAQVEEDIKEFYGSDPKKIVSPKALKLITTRFKNKVIPHFNSPMEILSMNEEKFVKQVKQVGLETERILSYLRKKYCEIQIKEKQEEAKEQRFLDYKERLDKEYEELKKDLELKYNPKFKLKELYLLVQTLQTCGIDCEKTDIVIDLSKMEKFRSEVVQIMHT